MLVQRLCDRDFSAASLSERRLVEAAQFAAVQAHAVLAQQVHGGDADPQVLADGPAPAKRLAPTARAGRRVAVIDPENSVSLRLGIQFGGELCVSALSG